MNSSACPSGLAALAAPVAAPRIGCIVRANTFAVENAVVAPVWGKRNP
jgi:hypothetical protein